MSNNTHTNDTPRVYIAVLADYNNGTLTGEWIDALDVDDMQSEIDRILRSSKYPNVRVECPECDGNKELPHATWSHIPCPTCYGAGTVLSAEEYAIHDYEGFGALASTLGEYPKLEDVAYNGEMIQEHGEAWALWAANCGDVHMREEYFEEAYCGEYDSKEAYAQELADDMGDVPEAGAARWPLYHIDWEAAARDLVMDGYTFLRASDGTGYVFRDC